MRAFYSEGLTEVTVIESAEFEGMGGRITTSEICVEAGGTLETPVDGLPDLYSVDVVCVSYMDPQYSSSFVFESKPLPGAKSPPAQLKSYDLAKLGDHSEGEEEVLDEDSIIWVLEHIKHLFTNQATDTSISRYKVRTETMEVSTVVDQMNIVRITVYPPIKNLHITMLIPISVRPTRYKVRSEIMELLIAVDPMDSLHITMPLLIKAMRTEVLLMLQDQIVLSINQINTGAPVDISRREVIHMDTKVEDHIILYLDQDTVDHHPVEALEDQNEDVNHRPGTRVMEPSIFREDIKEGKQLKT